MEEKDFIKELFQEKLAQHQSPVSPELWASVSSSISTGTTVVSSGLSVLTKSVIAGLSAAALIGSVWFMNQPASTSTKKPLNNVKRPIEKTETTKTESPADSNNALNADSPVKIQPIPIADFQEEISKFGSEISRSNNATVPDPVLSFTPPTFEQSNITNSLTTVQNNTIVQQEMPVSNIQEAAIILPNVFTPNGDGNNDVFSIDLGSYAFVDYSLVILDKTNQLVFKSSLTQEIWDGKNVNGDRCPKGNYVYYLTGKTDTGKTITKYSTLRIEY